MALAAPTYKSVGIILAIAIAGAIIVVATVLSQNKQKTPTVEQVKPLRDATSGLVIDVPNSWTVSKTDSTTLRVEGFRLADIQSQKSTCLDTSSEISRTIQKNLTTGSTQATTNWQIEYPGLITSQVLKGSGTVYSTVGIDTCNPSFNVRTLTFRGQAYKNSTELRITQVIPQEIPEDSQTSQTTLDKLAQSLADGTAPKDLQANFNQFVAVMASVR